MGPLFVIVRNIFYIVLLEGTSINSNHVIPAKAGIYQLLTYRKVGIKLQTK